MPYSGNNLSEIRKDAGIDNEEEFYGIVNKLGNKLLLEEKINRAIGNEWFRTKVSTKLENKTGYINSRYPVACALVSEYQEKVRKNVEKYPVEKAYGHKVITFKTLINEMIADAWYMVLEYRLNQGLIKIQDEWKGVLRLILNRRTLLSVPLWSASAAALLPQSPMRYAE